MKRKALQVSTAKVTHGDHELTVAIEAVDPMTAEIYLGRNDRNRRVVDKNVHDLAAAMMRGEWSMNGEPIIFDSAGGLADGQHRLLAIVHSGLTVLSLVVRGVEPETAQDTMGIGAKRSISGQLSVHGEENANNLAASIGVYYKLTNFHEWTNMVPTILQALKILEEHPGLREAAAFGSKANRSVLKYSAGSAGALWYLFGTVDKEDAEVFWKKTLEGDTPNENDPIYHLRNRMIRDATLGAGKPRMNSRYRAGITIKAWNFWRAGIELSTLRYTVGGAQREAFPRYDADAEMMPSSGKDIA